MTQIRGTSETILNKKERLIMPAALYARDSDISPKNLSNPSLCAKNRLNLLPEHLAEIGAAFMKQLTRSSLTSRNLRILITIYKQTIGYDKREDDMNGECLRMLTGIRNDHANEAVRRLEALNIIITHKGSYGKWMSINFDLPNWGKAPSDSTTNDPSGLLSEIYQSPFPQDDEDLEFSLYIPPESSEKESAKVIKLDEKAVPPKPIAPAEVIQSPVKLQHSSTETPAPVPVKPPSPATEKSQSEPIKPVLSSTQKPQPNPAKPTLLSTKKPATDPVKLHFPDTFPEKLRQWIIRDLAPLNIPEKAQRLLDYFIKCLNSGNVRDPIAYFNGLKNRWLKGALDLNDDQQTPVIVQSDEKKRQQQQKIEHRIAYQEAISDIQQLQKVIKGEIDEKHSTFEEALKKINFTSIWETAVECLEQTKKAHFSLDIAHKFNTG